MLGIFHNDQHVFVSGVRQILYPNIFNHINTSKIDPKYIWKQYISANKKRYIAISCVIYINGLNLTGSKTNVKLSQNVLAWSNLKQTTKFSSQFIILSTYQYIAMAMKLIASHITQWGMKWNVQFIVKKMVKKSHYLGGFLITDKEYKVNW